MSIETLSNLCDYFEVTPNYYQRVQMRQGSNSCLIFLKKIRKLCYKTVNFTVLVVEGVWFTFLFCCFFIYAHGILQFERGGTIW